MLSNNKGSTKTWMLISLSILIVLVVAEPNLTPTLTDSNSSEDKATLIDTLTIVSETLNETFETNGTIDNDADNNETEINETEAPKGNETELPETNENELPEDNETGLPELNETDAPEGNETIPGNETDLPETNQTGLLDTKEIFGIGKGGGDGFHILSDSFDDGDGSPENPYQVSNCTSLQDIDDNVSAHYIQTQDIDCTGITWYGIGTSANPFNGSFNGQNYEITDITITFMHPGKGFFEYVEDAEISNVYINGFTSTNRDDDTGALVGVALGNTTIENCVIVDGDVSGSDNVGGIVGRAGKSFYPYNGGVTISSCNFTGTVDAWGHSLSGLSGGIVGAAYGDTTIDDCHVDGTILGGNSVGGIVGRSGNRSSVAPHSGGTVITDSTFSGVIDTAEYSMGTGAGGHGGGIVGMGNHNLTIQDCDVDASIRNGEKMGGVAGSMSAWASSNTNGLMERCSFTGNINCSATYCGGLVGYASSNIIIRNSYAAEGLINSTSGRVGGLVGWLDRSDLNKSYSRMQVDGDVFVAGLVGKMSDSRMNDCFRAVYYGLTQNGTYGAMAVGYMEDSNISNIWWSDYPDDNVSSHSCHYTYNNAGPGYYSNDSCTYAEFGGYIGNQYFYNYNNQPIASWSFPPWDDENSGVQTPTLQRSIFSGGSGTADDPYVIDDGSQIGGVGNQPGGHYSLPNGTIEVDPGADPIGTPDDPFTGSFVGNGTIITGVNVTGGGFFGTIENGTVANITLQGNVSGGDSTGGFAGNITGNSTIEGVVVNMTVTGTGNNTGGFAGSIGGNVTITNVSVGGNVSGGTNTGGFAGNVSGNTSVSGVTVTGNVSGGNNTGGFAGTVGGNASVGGVTVTGNVSGGNNTGGFAGTIGGSASVNNASTTGTVNSTGRAGGIAGTVGGNAEVTNSFATGNVTGEDDVGGCLGSIDDSGVVKDIYCRGDVTGDTNVGGLAGRISQNSVIINNTYATGEVTGNTNTGGLVGHNPPTGTVLYSFYDMNTTGQSDNEGKGVPKTTYWMKYIFTFYNAGWDINADNDGWDADIWGINAAENDGYPFLKWQGYSSRGLFDDGAGTSGDPYQINICNYLNETELFLDDHFTITQDLTCSDKRAGFGQDLTVSDDFVFDDVYFKAPDLTLASGGSIQMTSSTLQLDNYYIEAGASFVMTESDNTTEPGTTTFTCALEDVYDPNVIIISLFAEGALSYRYCYTTDGTDCSPDTYTRKEIILSGVNDYTVCAKSVNLYGDGDVVCSLANQYTISST